MESTNIKKLYACDDCVHSFDTTVHLNILQCTKERNNILLSTVIYHTGCLTKHIAIHTGDKPYAC